MRQTIVVLSGIPGTSPDFSFRSLACGFEALGYKVVTVDIADNGITEKIANVVTEEDVLFFLTHNLRGWDIRYEMNGKEDFFYDFFDVWFVTLVDTPLNKIEALKKSGHKKLLLFSDKSFLPLVEGVSPPNTVCAYLPAFVIDDQPVGEKRKVKDVYERDIDVLWVGRVGANTGFMDQIKNIWKRAAMRKVVREAVFTTDKQIHDIITEVLRKNFLLRLHPFFRNPYSSKFLYFAWGLSNLVRAKRRMMVLEELASLPSKTKMVVVSNNSQSIRGMFKSNAEFLPFQEWPRVVELMGNAKIVINVQPFHVYGSHERLITAMAHGAVVATDKNPYLEERFKDGYDVIFYEFEKGNLRKRLMEHLDDVDRLRSMAQQGAEKVLKQDLAIHRARDIIALVDRVSSGRASSPNAAAHSATATAGDSSRAM